MFSQFKTPCLHRQSSVIKHPPTSNLLFKHNDILFLGASVKLRRKQISVPELCSTSGLTYTLKRKKWNLWNLPEEFFQWGKWKLRHLGCLGWTQNVRPKQKVKKKTLTEITITLVAILPVVKGWSRSSKRVLKRNVCFALFFSVFFLSNFWSSDTDQRGR